MKVVLFCGGLGLRMREASERIPKPMVQIGNRPILWHVMKYFAHYGHREFVLCLGHGAEVIKDFFLRYDEAISNDFVLTEGGRSIELLQSDITDWRITFVDTGLRASVGERLRAVRAHLEGDEMFLANYGDTLTDAPLPEMIDHLEASGGVAQFLAVRPAYTFHTVTFSEGERVEEILDVTQSGIWINGGYFAFRTELFDYMQEGEDIVEEPFHRLIAEGKLVGYRHEGFWAPMDTLKDRTVLESMLEAGTTPWRVWEPFDGSHPKRPHDALPEA